MRPSFLLDLGATSAAAAWERLPPALRRELEPVLAPVLRAGRRAWPRVEGALPERLTAGHWLTAVCAIAIALLAVVRAAAGPGVVEHVLQLVLAVCFIRLAIVDLRLAVGVVIFELALFGAGGHWTVFPGGVSGRNFLLACVTLRAGIPVFAVWRRHRRLLLGPYAGHLIGLAAVLGLGWIAVGVAEGNGASTAFADGNGVLFLTFVVPVLVLIGRRAAPWLRRCLFAACAANAVLTGLGVAVMASGVISQNTVEDVLLRRLDFGGAVGRLADGTIRLYLGSGLYLQVGVALTTWYLLSRPRNLWLWGLYVLLWLDVLASYTRGYWLGAILAAGLVLVLGMPNVRVALRMVGTAGGLAVATVVAGLVLGLFSSASLGNRTRTLVGAFQEPRHAPERPRHPRFGPFVPSQPGLEAVRPAWQQAALPTRATRGYVPRGGVTRPRVRPGQQNESQVSDLIRQRQATVLWRHIRARPVIGSGFGAIARDYRFSAGYSYELSYLALLFKTGVLGTLLFLSVPARLLWDAVRMRLGRVRVTGLDPQAAAVPAAIVVSLLVLGATNPYLLAAFGLAPMLLSLAWLLPREWSAA